MEDSIAILTGRTDENIEDTIVVRGPRALQKSMAHSKMANPLVSRVATTNDDQSSAMDCEMEDRIIIRGALPVDNSNKKIPEVGSDEHQSMAISKEGHERLQNIISQIEELRSQASFNISWREEAEADYVLTRKKVTESEALVAGSVASMDCLQQTVINIGSQVSQIEADMAMKSGQLESIQSGVSALTAKAIDAESALSNILNRVIYLEARELDHEGKLGFQPTAFGQETSALKGELSAIIDHEILKLKEEIKLISGMWLMEKEMNSKISARFEQEIDELKQNLKKERKLRTKLEDKISTYEVNMFQGGQRIKDLDNIEICDAEDCNEVQVPCSPLMEKNDGLESSIHREPPLTTFSLPSTVPPNNTRESVLLTITPNFSCQSTPSNTNITFNPPTGPKAWRVKQQKRDDNKSNRLSGSSKTQRKKIQKSSVKARAQTRLQNIEVELDKLKKEIERREALLSRNTQPPAISPSGSNKRKWQIVKSRKPAPSSENPKPIEKCEWAKRMSGKFKLVIGAADDGSYENITQVYEEIKRDKENKSLLKFLGTVRNLRFEYHNRRILNHNHRGGILFSVELPQEAARCLNLGIYIGGRKHRVFAFTKARANSMCAHCSSWGHLERSCRYNSQGRCGICSGGHRTNLHSPIARRNRKDTLMCPNCCGNHTAEADICPEKIKAYKMALSHHGIDQPSGGRRRNQKRGASHSHGPGRRHV